MSPPLFEETGSPALPLVEASEGVLRALRHCRRAGDLVGGLEKIVQELTKEREGLLALAQREIQNQPQVVTRIVLLSNEGTERFYRTALRQLKVFEPWVAVLRLNLAPQSCGEQFFGSQSGVKALLIGQKEWVGQFLESWLEDFDTND